MATSEKIYNDLHSKYKKQTISKVELANEMSCGVSTLTKYINQGIGLPNYIKVGKTRNARILFPIRDVAEFLSQTVKTL